MKSLRERPRIRPSSCILVIVVAAASLYLFVENQDWLSGLLASGRMDNVLFYVSWAILGVASAFLAIRFWFLCVPRSTRVRTLLIYPLIAGPLVGGSLAAARRDIRSVGLYIRGITWTGGEVVIETQSSPAVADAYERGALDVLTSVEGILWTQADRQNGPGTAAPPIESQEIVAGSPELLGRYRWTALPVLPHVH